LILFLDVDGVLHPEGPSREPKFCRLPLLEEWLRGRPGVEVVISSSWREVHPFEELVSFFAEDRPWPQRRQCRRSPRNSLISS
jgi:hypothetical protein